eukprot:232206_1
MSTFGLVFICAVVVYISGSSAEKLSCPQDQAGWVFKNIEKQLFMVKGKGSEKIERKISRGSINNLDVYLNVGEEFMKFKVTSLMHAKGALEYKKVAGAIKQVSQQYFFLYMREPHRTKEVRINVMELMHALNHGEAMIDIVGWLSHEYLTCNGVEKENHYDPTGKTTWTKEKARLGDPDTDEWRYSPKTSAYSQLYNVLQVLEEVQVLEEEEETEEAYTRGYHAGFHAARLIKNEMED